MKPVRLKRATAVAKPKPDRRGAVTIALLALLVSLIWAGQAFAQADPQDGRQGRGDGDDRPQVVCTDWVPAALQLDGKRRDLERSRPIEGPVSSGDCITA